MSRASNLTHNTEFSNVVPWSSGMTTHCGYFNSVLAPVRFRVAPFFFFFPPTLAHIIRRGREEVRSVTSKGAWTNARPRP
ncbi:hypothetical protein ACN38_g9549 [Penicillium nordicum]|uniref:Uncharacterized protein n=1 Tax=Penicillium nordicum TaxID=229535 RepID=A0A0M8NUD8_9EURO|nr:hypothetical protein ACN38_g9549 [Penicillium nordicum]